MHVLTNYELISATWRAMFGPDIIRTWRQVYLEIGYSIPHKYFINNLFTNFKGSFTSKLQQVP